MNIHIAKKWPGMVVHIGTYRSFIKELSFVYRLYLAKRVKIVIKNG